jgi:hypothetical protein
MEDGTKNEDSRKEQEKESHPILSKDKWVASFTDRMLVAGNNNHNRNDGDGDAFVLLENVMESGQGNDFCNCLRDELDLFLERLKPARTKGDTHADTILDLLQSMGTHQLLPDHQHQENLHQQQRRKQQIYSSDSVRGDKSLFISREYRQRESFATRNPYLNRLIATISNTFEREFNSTSSKHNDDRLKLDLSMTSVQIALYPGDGKSGYRRHCDRHNSCKEEEETENIEVDVVSQQQQLSPDPLYITPTSNNERIITVIYYLTDDDWDAELDGGALRMFHTDSSNTNTDGGTTTVKSDMGENGSSSDFFDVIPFRDRMVVFRSDRVEHQVMPSLRRPRLAITLWFYGTIEKSLTNRDSIITESGDKTTNTVLISTNVTESIIPRELISSHGRHPPPPLPISSLSTPPLLSIASSAAGFDDNNSDPTIFVSIASYRDSETRPTLDALFSTAKNPGRIFVGIVVQLEEKEKDDEDIWYSIMAGTSQSVHSWKPQPHQVRCIRLNARDATGPCYARGLCQTLLRGEDYFMQIDSHMRFRQNWDEYLIQTIQGIQQYNQTSNEKGISTNKIVLTAYPVGYTLPNNIPQETRGTYLVPWKFDKNGMLRQRGRLLRSTVDQTDIGELNPNLHKPIGEHPLAITHARRQYLYAGGFNFGPSEVITDVPYDMMGMHHLFFGEELSMSIRLFTNGYDLYCPNETVCYHLWSRAHRPKTTGSATVTAASTAYKQRLQKLSMEKVKQQLLGDQIGKPFGLGKARTAAAFADKLGVDFRRQTFVRDGWEFGELCSEDFVGGDDNGVCSRLVFPEDSVEAKVASLDSKSKELIGMFLMGIN